MTRDSNQRKCQRIEIALWWGGEASPLGKAEIKFKATPFVPLEELKMQPTHTAQPTHGATGPAAVAVLAWWRVMA